MNILFIIGLVIAILSMLSIARLKAHWHFRKWAKQLHLRKHEKIYHRLFKHVDGFALSRIARLQNDAIEYLYGEIDFLAFIILLSLVQPDEETVFYDLGSGVGKAVMACAMVFNVQKSCGIELFENLHRCAIKQQQSLSKLKNYQDKASRIEYIQGDFMNTDFDEATLIFVNATGFISPLWDNLSTRIAASRCQTVISTSKPIEHESFRVTHKLQTPMSWGPATVFIQERCS